MENVKKAGDLMDGVRGEPDRWVRKGLREEKTGDGNGECGERGTQRAKETANRTVRWRGIVVKTNAEDGHEARKTRILKIYEQKVTRNKKASRKGRMGRNGGK